MTRKKILLDLRLWDPYTGIGIVTGKFLELLQKGDFELSYVYNDSISDPAIQNSPGSIKLGSVYGIADYVKLYWHLKKHRPDIIIFPHYFVGLFIPRGIKVISFVHDIMAISNWRNFWPSFGRIKALILKYYLLVALKNVRIVVPSYTVKEDVERVLKYPSEVVPNGLANSDINIEKGEVNLANKSGYLYIGNTRKHKNLDFLLRAFQKHTDTLNIVSKNSVSEHKNTTLYKNIDAPQLKRMLAETTALLIPSFSEGFCLPVIEAMKLDTKVYASRIPVFKEFYGLEISYFDLKDLLEIDFVLDNPQLTYNDKVFTNVLKTDKLFNWFELRYFIQHL